METLAGPLMLFFGALALVTALGGIFGVVLATLYKGKAVYWWRISGGISYLSLSAAGAIAIGFLNEGRAVTATIVVVLTLLGAWLLNLGLRLRQKALNGES